MVKAITSKRQRKLRNETKVSQNHSIPSESPDEAPTFQNRVLPFSTPAFHDHSRQGLGLLPAENVQAVPEQS